MKIPSGRTLKRHLKSVPQYLNQYPIRLRSTYYEYFISQIISRIFHIPFFTSVNDDGSTSKKVVWNGALDPIQIAQGGAADSLLYANGFNGVIEITRKTGVRQWTQEGYQLFTHTDEAVLNFGWEMDNTFTLFIVPQLSREAFLHLQGVGSRGYNIVLIENETLNKILHTSILAFTLKHLELRSLFAEFTEYLRQRPNLRSYQNAVERFTNEWSEQVFEQEKDVIVALKAYESMKNIGRLHVSRGELYANLHRHPYLRQYLKKTETNLHEDLLVDCLIRQGFAICVSTLYEKLLVPVPVDDYIHRSSRINKKADEIWS